MNYVHYTNELCSSEFSKDTIHPTGPQFLVHMYFRVECITSLMDIQYLTTSEAKNKRIRLSVCSMVHYNQAG